MFAATMLFIVFTLIASPALAQAPYVGAAVGMDVSRFDRIEATGFDVTSGGEVINFSLRLGTAIRDNWGVEVGFTQPSKLERESGGGIPIPLLASAGTGPNTITGPNIVAPGIGVAIPSFQVSMSSERRNTTLDTVAWVAQSVGNRVDLVYLGGIAFNRVVQDINFQFIRGAIGIVAPNSTRTISYDVGPVVGVEARIGLTDHVRLVPGVRLQSIGGSGDEGWLLRPSAGLAWQF